jgi:hypothetical protein
VLGIDAVPIGEPVGSGILGYGGSLSAMLVSLA